jgi:uncharacterized protein
MRFIVSDIPEEGLSHDFDLPADIKGDGHQEIAHAEVKVRRSGDRIFCDGRVRMSTLLECSRCLIEYTSDLNVIFNEVYLPASETFEEDACELNVKASSSAYYSNDEIDLDGLIREQLLLALPMKPICKEDCRGICSKCGADLNNNLCGCKNDVIDPRWVPLKKLNKTLK